MGNARAIEAGGAYVRLFTQDSDMVRGLRKAEKNFHAWAGKINRAGGSLLAGAFAVGAPLAAAVKIYSDAGSALNDLAGRTGASTDALQRLSFAAKMTGSDAEALEVGIKKLGKNIGEALSGDKAANGMFASLGLSAQQLAKMPLDKQFELIADRLSKIPEGALRTKATFDLLGKSGTDLLPMLIGGGAELATYGKRLEELGVIKTPQAIAAADDLGDRMDEVGMVLTHTAFVVGDVLAPMVMQLADNVIQITKSANEWIDANEGVITTVALVTAGVGAAGVSLVVLGTATHVVAAGFGMMATAAVAVTSPLGMIAAAAGGIGYVVATQTTEAIDALDQLATFSVQVGEDIKTSWDGVTDAVAAGDLALAGEVAMAGLNVVWQAGVREWATTIATMENLGVNVFAAISTFWVDAVGIMFDAWDMLDRKVSQSQKGWSHVIVEAGFRSGLMKGDRVDAHRQLNDMEQNRNAGRDLAASKRHAAAQQKKADIAKDQDNALAEVQLAQMENLSGQKLIAAREQLAKLRDKAAQAKVSADSKRAGTVKKERKKPDEDLPEAAGGKGSTKSSEATTSGLAASLNRSYSPANTPESAMDRLGSATDAATGKIRDQTAALKERNDAAAALQKKKNDEQAKRWVANVAKQPERKPAAPAGGGDPVLDWAEKQGLPLPNTNAEYDALKGKFDKSATAKRQQPQPVAAVPPPKPAGGGDPVLDWAEKQGLPLPDTNADYDALKGKFDKSATAKRMQSPALPPGLANLPMPDIAKQFGGLRMPDLDPPMSAGLEQKIKQSGSTNDNKTLDDVLAELKKLNANVLTSGMLGP